MVAFVAIQIEVEFGANASVQIEAGQEEKYKENLSLDRDSRKEQTKIHSGEERPK